MFDMKIFHVGLCLDSQRIQLKSLCITTEKFLLDSMAKFDQDFACVHVKTITKLYLVSIYILLSQKPFANNKNGNTIDPELTAFPIHL